MLLCRCYYGVPDGCYGVSLWLLKCYSGQHHPRRRDEALYFGKSRLKMKLLKQQGPDLSGAQ